MSQQIGELVSKQAVDTLVDELARAISDERCCMSRGRDTSTIMQDILDLPPVTQKWIPVSERLPKAEYGESDSVLVCFENETQDVLYFDGSNWRYPTGEVYISVNHKNGWHNKVVAWMPLPAPFEPQESESKRYAELAKSYVQGLRAGLAEGEVEE